MSAASSASRPPMKMPVRATPLGPREKIVSCVRPAIASSADLAVRHDDLVAGVGGHVDVERAHLAARREHVKDVGAFHGGRFVIGSEAMGRPIQRGAAACGRSTRRVGAAGCAHATMRSVERRDRRSAGARRAASTSALRGRGRRHDRKAGRPPRALADRRATALVRATTCISAADGGAGLGAAALRRREVLAEQLLHAVDAGGEGARSRRSPRPAARASAPGGRCRRPAPAAAAAARRWPSFLAARQAALRASSSTTITRHVDGQGSMRASSGAGRAVGAGAAVDEQAALVEAGDADARAQAAARASARACGVAGRADASARRRGRSPARAGCPSRSRRAPAAPARRRSAQRRVAAGALAQQLQAGVAARSSSACAAGESAIERVGRWRQRFRPRSRSRRSPARGCRSAAPASRTGRGNPGAAAPARTRGSPLARRAAGLRRAQSWRQVRACCAQARVVPPRRPERAWPWAASSPRRPGCRTRRCPW